MRHPARAFTLIELAVVLLVVSLMVGFGMQAFQSNTSLTCYDKTEAQLKVIDRALQSYAGSNNRLPKPALMDYGSNNAQFGYEAKGTVTDTTSANYSTNNGNGNPSTMATYTVGATNVLIGALPHAELGLSVDYAADCWGNKFTYAVTNSLTNSSASGYPGSASGAITLNSNTLSSAVLLGSSVAYAVISHGPDKVGATPLSASDITPRSCSLSGTKIDNQNCNLDATFFTAIRNTGTGANYFDDLLVFSNRNAASSGCAAATVPWTGAVSGCSAPVSAMAEGASSAGVANTASGYNGTATITCTSGVLVASAPVCTVVPPSNCLAQAVTWGSCSATAGALTHGNSAGVTNTASGYTGTATATCNNGTTTASAGTCNANCAAQGVTWSTNCAGMAGGLSHGGSAVISNTNSGYTGTTNVACSNGTLSVTAPTSCNVVPPNNCNAQTVSWGSGCSATAGALTHGNSAGVTNTASGYTGSATATCSNGTSSAVGGTCNANCVAGTANWNPGCSGNYGALAHSANTLVTNTAGGYAGSVTVTCTNGSIGTSGATCNVSVPCCAVNDPPQGMAWVYGGGNACAPAPNGTNCSTGLGSYYGDCTSGSCDGCGAGAVSWNGATAGCGANVGALNSGSSTVATNTVAGKSGTANVTCNDGTLSAAGVSCTVAASCGGTLVGGYCFYLGANNATCTVTCAAHGGFDAFGGTWYGGSSGTNAQCDEILTALRGVAPWIATGTVANQKGCHYRAAVDGGLRGTNPTNQGTAAGAGYQRACACNS